MAGSQQIEPGKEKPSQSDEDSAHMEMYQDWIRIVSPNGYKEWAL